MKSFFFDTNAYLNLVSGSNNDLRHRVVSSVNSGNMRVVGSEHILEEFAVIASKTAESARASLDFFWEVANASVLRKRDDLVLDELRKGSKLSLKEGCHAPDNIARLRTLSRHPTETAKFAPPVRARRSAFASTMNEASAFLEKRIEQLIETRGSPRDWDVFVREFSINEAQISDWYSDLFGRVLRDADRGRFPKTPLPSVSDVPCARAFVSWYLSSIKKRLGVGRKFKPNDSYDVEHYVSAAMTDAFVTDDDALRKIADLIEWRPVRIMNLAEFAESRSLDCRSTLR